MAEREVRDRELHLADSVCRIQFGGRARRRVHVEAALPRDSVRHWVREM